MYPYNTEINATRADDDQAWRINRIYLVIGYAQALADLQKNEGFHVKIKSIYEHKGALTITWAIKPSDDEKGYIQKAWESIVTDYESNPIVHEIV